MTLPGPWSMEGDREGMTHCGPGIKEGNRDDMAFCGRRSGSWKRDGTSPEGEPGGDTGSCATPGTGQTPGLPDEPGPGVGGDPTDGPMMDTSPFTGADPATGPVLVAGTSPAMGDGPTPGHGPAGQPVQEMPPQDGTSCTCCPGPVPQDMFEILSNGIFAFTMTLIVKNNFPTPSHVPSDDLPFLFKFLDEIANDATIFVFTFAIVSVFYILFFEMLRNLRILDRGFVYISFGFFLSIIFIPLTTLLWIFSDVPIPYGVLFHANILLCGVVMLILWQHASRWQRLLIPGTPDAQVTNITRRMALFPITAVVGLLLDGWDVSFGAVPITVLYAIPILLFVIMSRDH